MAHTDTLFTSAEPNLLIAVDGSIFSEHATRKGIELAQRLNANLYLLCVIDLSNVVGNASVGGVIDAEIMKIYHEEAEKVIDSLIKKFPYAKATKLVQEGIPSETILRMARNHKADIIIMGTHGRTGLRHLFMGSVAEYVVRHSQIPVLVVPENKDKK